MSLKGRRLLVLVVIAALGVAGLLSLIIGSTPIHTLPNPNGYDNFVQAGNAILGDVSSFWDLDHDALRALVSSNAEPLRLVRLGLSRKCSFPTDFALTNQNWMIGELPHQKRLALLLRAEGRLAEVEGRPGDAADSYLQAIRFGNEISRGGFLINRLVGIACEAIGEDGHNLAVSSHPQSPMTLARRRHKATQKLKRIAATGISACEKCKTFVRVVSNPSLTGGANVIA